MLKTLQEFDLLSKNIKTELKNNIESNFAKITTDNIARALYVLAEGSNYNKVQISQAEIAIQLNLSQNRISELLKLAKKAGLIAIDQICRCGNIRNEYTLLNNPIINSIKNVVLNSKEPDSKESIELALEDAMNLYRAEGEPEHILEAVKRKMRNYKIKKASGVSTYFELTLITVKKAIAKSKAATTYKTSKKNNFNDYPQRKYDFDELEKRLLGTAQSEEIEEEPCDTQAFINSLRE